MISFSTCWNSDRHTKGNVMLREIVELGFTQVELGHGIRISLMEGIQKFFNRGKVTFSSLHNFCPLPIEVTRSSPDCYKFSSPHPSERERAVKLTFQTLDFAERLNVPRVVLHLGRVEMERASNSLITMINNGEYLSRKYVRKKLALIKKREAKAPAYLERTKDCLKRIVEYAAKKNVKLGIESRFGYEEIPNERELPALLKEINAPHVGYWHDFGHVQVKHNLGFLDHAEWLEKMAPHLVGCHLHDTRWPGGDHRAPFTGGIDYDRLVPLLPKDTLFVWEMSPRRTAEEIVESVEKWKARFGE